jgi:lytic murein transglycosylase
MPRTAARIFCLAFIVMLATPALSATCQNAGTFESWPAGFKREAAAAGISPRTIGAALAGVTYDPGVIKRDRSQRVFKQSFEQFSGRMVPPRLKRAAGMMKQHQKLLSTIEKQFGVPGAVVIAIWGLESDFGANRGNLSTIRSLATLAYDCRRSAFFTNELMAALMVIERGDLSPAAMRGGWAGELGQTQFLPSSYYRFAVDFDGNGRRDLIGSVADVLASTANYLKGYGWQAGEPWGEGTANFAVIKQWNKSTVYSQTVAYFATRLAGGS